MTGLCAPPLLSLLALAACANDASGRFAIVDSAPANTAERNADEREQTSTRVRRVADPRDLGIDNDLLGVAVFDARGRLVALYPVPHAERMDRELPALISGEHAAPDEGFELLAADIGVNLGARLTFDPAYDPNDPHTFVVSSRYGTLRICSLKVNSLAPMSGEPLTESADVRLEQDAPANGSLLHANPDCLVRGPRWGTVSYRALTFQAVPVEKSASVTAPFPDASSSSDDAGGGEPYEIILFISELATPCQSANPDP